MPRKHLNILILNWRDIKNPSSGGAEVLTHEMAKRWVAWGHQVTQFSSRFKGAKKEEIIDGVKLTRRGNPDARHLTNSVHFKAYEHYRKYFKGKFDVVIDEIHGLPFFSPLYVKEKKVVLICEVAGKIWDSNFPFPFNKIGKSIERNYFKFYKNIPFLTISASTEQDLKEFGVPKDNIVVLPMGISVPKKLPNLKKEKSPTLVFVGRLLKAKGIEDAIEVCRILEPKFPDIKLWIIGRGEKDYENKIKKRVKDLGLEKKILFLGFINQNKKFEMVGRAHILLAPSVKEGYGLTVPEAGIVGTPAVAYNVEGLRDIIKNMQSGILVNPNPKNMALQVKNIFNDSNLYKKIQEGALFFAKSLSWDRSANDALRLLEKVPYR